jgi:transposase-like protein
MRQFRRLSCIARIVEATQPDAILVKIARRYGIFSGVLRLWSRRWPPFPRSAPAFQNGDPASQ